MVSAQSCDNDTSEYHLCRKDPELTPSDKACYYLKKGKPTKTQVSWTFFELYLEYNILELIFMFVYIYKNVIVLHCHDELLNGDETGVDCGGSCEACKGTYY